MTDGRPVFAIRPSAARWTHLALRVGDLDASIAWYAEFTPLELLDRRQDELGFGAWLAQPGSPDQPFVLVLAQFLPETDPYGAHPKEVLTPFAHLGIELPAHADVDDVAARGARAGCLAVPPREMGPPVGYVCMLRDPDGNMVEFSYDQGVFAIAHDRWATPE